jgi:MFS family permease
VSSSALRGLRSSPYRTFVLGALAGSVGAWMLRTAQLVLVVDLTGGDGSSVGLTSAAQYVPTLALGALIGVQADRRSKTWMLVTAQAIMVLSALTQALLLTLDRDQSWAVAGLAVMFGIGVAIDGPLRTAVVPDLVPVQDISSAVSLNVTILQLGRLVGPMCAGFLIVGTSYEVTFLLSAVALVPFLVTIPFVTRKQEVSPDLEPPGGLRTGFAYLRRQPRILVIFGLIGIGGVVGPNLFTLASLMIYDEFGGGPREIAYASSALAVGAIIGSLLAARFSGGTLTATVLLTMTVGVTCTVSSAAPTLVSYVVVLMFAGAAALGMASRGTASVQRLVSPAMRGRVTGIYFVVLIAGAPLGAPVIGWLAEAVGVRTAVAGAGVFVLVCAIALGLIARRLGNEPVPGVVPLTEPATAQRLQTSGRATTEGS